MDYSTDYEKLFFLYALEKPRYFSKFYKGFFTDEFIDILANTAAEFYEKHKESPRKDQMKLLIQQSKYKDKIDADLINTVYATNLREYDEDWLKRISESWIKWRNFDSQMINMMEYIKTQNVDPDNVDGIINKAIKMLQEKGNITFDTDLGLDFFNVEDHKQDKTNKVNSGKNFVDGITGGGYDKKTLIVYAGEQNIGKSIWLANDAADFVTRGYNTVFITFEMGASKVVKRIGANILNIKMSEYDQLSRDHKMIKRKLATVGSGVMPPGKLFIKEYPTSAAGVPDIEAYLKELEEITGIKVQVVIIDYINIVKNYRNPHTENTYMKIKQIAEDLRGMAVRNDFLIISATQINRGGWDSTEVKMENIAESAGLAHTADIVYAIIQDTIMHTENQYILKVLKIRDGFGKGTKCTFNINYEYMRLIETGNVVGSSDV